LERKIELRLVLSILDGPAGLSQPVGRAYMDMNEELLVTNGTR